MPSRKKKDRRAANRAAKANATPTGAQHVIYDATGEDLIIKEVSEQEFAEANRGYLVGGRVPMPGGGELVLAYPEDDPDADPNDPPAWDGAPSAGEDPAVGVLNRMWELLAEFSATVAEEKHLEDGVVLVGGFHLFPSTIERITQFGTTGLLPQRDGLPPLVPVQWVVLETQVALNQVAAQAVDPRLIARLMTDIVEAEESEDSEQALRSLIEDPMRYLGKVA